MTTINNKKVSAEKEALLLALGVAELSDKQRDYWFKMIDLASDKDCEVINKALKENAGNLKKLTDEMEKKVEEELAKLRQA